MIQGFFILLLFILPFIINPFGGAYFEPPKVMVAEVVIEMLLVYCLLTTKLKLKSRFLYPIAAIFVISILNLIFHPSNTIFFGNQFRLQGTFLLWHLLILALISSQIEFKIPKRLAYLLLPALLLVTVLMGFESNNRAIGTLGEPNALAAVAIFFWPFIWFQSSKKLFGKLVKLGVFIITLVVIFFSGSRSGFIAFLIQLVFLLTLKLSKSLKVALVVGLLLFVGSLSLPFIETTSGFKFEDRAEVWRVAFNAGLQNPLIGQGFGNIENVLKPTAQNLNSDLQYQYVDSAHNLLLDYWIEGGLLGVGALILLIFIALKNFYRSHSVLEITLLFGLLIVLSFNPVSVVTLVSFWWLIGQKLKPIVDS